MRERMGALSVVNPYGSEHKNLPDIDGKIRELGEAWSGLEMGNLSQALRR